MPERITQAEFARRHNVTRQAVNDWVARGVVQLFDGLVDETEALAAIARAADPVRESKILISGPAGVATAADLPVNGSRRPEGSGDLPTPAEAESFHAARTRHQIALAAREEIKLAKDRGELVPVRIMEAALVRIATRIAAVLDAIEPKLAREAPHFTPEDLALIGRHIGEARDACADLEVGDIAEPSPEAVP